MEGGSGNKVKDQMVHNFYKPIILRHEFSEYLQMQLLALDMQLLWNLPHTRCIVVCGYVLCVIC